MKFIVIIIALAAIYYLISTLKKNKMIKKPSNNMELCNKCGFHMPKDLKCNDQSDIEKCKNMREDER